MTDIVLHVKRKILTYCFVMPFLCFYVLLDRAYKGVYINILKMFYASVFVI